MRTDRGLERLVAFSDAVVAIALTLLVLPLVEIPTRLSRGQGVAAVFADHRGLLGSFALSFVVIWSLWTTHHRTMEYFGGYDAMVVRLHMVWLFTIVSLPFTTQLLSGAAEVAGALPLYVGSLLVSVLALRGLSWWGHRHRELLRLDSDEAYEWLADPVSYGSEVTLAVALVLTLAVPALGAWSLLVLLLERPIDLVVARLRRDR